MFNIDGNGIGGRIRVWWLNDQGYTCQRLFDSKESAECWIEFMESLE